MINPPRHPYPHTTGCYTMASPRCHTNKEKDDEPSSAPACCRIKLVTKVFKRYLVKLTTIHHTCMQRFIIFHLACLSNWGLRRNGEPSHCHANNRKEIDDEIANRKHQPVTGSNQYPKSQNGPRVIKTHDQRFEESMNRKKGKPTTALRYHLLNRSTASVNLGPTTTFFQTLLRSA